MIQRVANVNTTDLKDAVRLGCRTMQFVFNADDDMAPFMRSCVWPEAELAFSGCHGESHIPGRHLNALLNAEDAAGITVDNDPDYTALSRADQYCYRTPHYQLSWVQDYRPGKPGFGQHIWQATLGGRAVVFTTHPDNVDLKDRPNYRSANGLMPRAAAYRNALVCIYRIDPFRHRWFGTHAWFPKFAFDEVVEQGGWVFGRKDKCYVALRSMNTASWHGPDERVLHEIYPFDDAAHACVADSSYELFAPGHASVWVCELGSRDQSGGFQEFVAAVSSTTLRG